MPYPTRNVPVGPERGTEATRHGVWPCRCLCSFPGVRKRIPEGLSAAFFPVMKIKNTIKLGPCKGRGRGLSVNFLVLRKFHLTGLRSHSWEVPQFNPDNLSPIFHSTVASLHREGCVLPGGSGCKENPVATLK